MNRVLIIGELLPSLGKIYEGLEGQFYTQMCDNSLQYVSAMIKIFPYDLVLYSIEEFGAREEEMLQMLMERNATRPIVLFGTQDVVDEYEQSHQDGCDNITTLVSPMIVEEIRKNCMELLLHGGKRDRSFRNKIDFSAIKRRRVLAVDDSGMMLRNLKTMLEDTYEITVANSGVLALSQAKRTIPDIILLDYEMPEWDGKKTLEELRKDEELKDIPVIFLTSVKDRSHITEVLNLKPAAYILKPAGKERIITAIEEVFHLISV